MSQRGHGGTQSGRDCAHLASVVAHGASLGLGIVVTGCLQTPMGERPLVRSIKESL